MWQPRLGSRCAVSAATRPRHSLAIGLRRHRSRCRESRLRGPSPPRFGTGGSITGHPDDQPTKIATVLRRSGRRVLWCDRGLGGTGPGRWPVGHGEHLEYSQVEGLVSLIPTPMMAVSAGETVGRRGDKSPAAVPHGFYRCAGEDAWVALSVRTDAEWNGSHGWPDGRARPLATLEERLAAQADIDTVVRRLGGGPVPLGSDPGLPGGAGAAYPVLSAQGLSLDDHLADRRFFRWVHRPVTGPGPIPGVSFRWRARRSGCGGRRRDGGAQPGCARRGARSRASKKSTR